MDEPTTLLHILRKWTEAFMQRSFRDFKRFMDMENLSPSQVGTLMHLYHCKGCGVSDIGTHLGITVPAASQMVERLVQQQLLERTEDPHDRRYKQVTLTETGRSMLEKGIAARQDWLERLTERFSPDEQELIIRALAMLTDAARQIDQEQA